MEQQNSKVPNGVSNVSLDSLMPLIKEQLSLGQSVKFAPHGISMLPMIRQGRDSIVLSPLPEKLSKYDIPLYQRANGQYVLHRIVAVGDTYTLMGDNQYTEEKGVTRESMIGVVTAFYRGEKLHSTKETGYRMYVVLWHNTRKIRHFARRCVRWLRRHIG